MTIVPNTCFFIDFHAVCLFQKARITERNNVRETIAKNKVNQVVFQLLKKEKIVVKAELRSLNVAY
jgi:hypothetical protein